MLFEWRRLSSWLEIRSALDGERLSAKRIRAMFDVRPARIRVFHATRTADVDSFYRSGLRLANHAEMREQARRIFLGAAHPELTSDLIERAFLADDSSTDDDRAFVALDRDELLASAGHYLVYGSEFICGLAARLCGPHTPDYRQELKKHGEPYLLTIDAPVTLLPDEAVEELSEKIATSLGWVERAKRVRPIDFTFRLRQPLPPASIVSHELVARVFDPILWREYQFSPRSRGDQTVRSDTAQHRSRTHITS
jgi:hypothetical protein